MKAAAHRQHYQVIAAYEREIIPIGPPAHRPLCKAAPDLLLFNGLLHVTHLILDRPGYFFANTSSFQVGIVRRTAHCFLDLALRFVNLAFNYILGTRFHLVSLY
jgi:hypothetical protein